MKPIQHSRVVSWAALLLVAVAFAFARDQVATEDDKRLLSERFAFDQEPISLPSIPGLRDPIFTREVHPSLERIKSWISATGAAITLADIDRDGLYNDMLLVDPRANTVVIQTVPGTGNRFDAFAIDPLGLEFDPHSMSPTGSLVGDFDEDGFEDILVYYWGRSPVIFYRNREASSLNKFSAASFMPHELLDGGPAQWHTHAGTQADIDGDGHLDLLLGNFFGDGADILNAKGTGVAKKMQADLSGAGNGGGAKLLLWQQNDRIRNFKDHSRSIQELCDGLCGTGWVLAIGAADLDPDSTDGRGLPEIYISHDFGPDRLLHNRSTPGAPSFVVCEGTRYFTTPKSFVLGRDSFKGMGLDFGDVNGDGLFDMFVSNISDDFALHEGHFVFVSTGKVDDFQHSRAPYQQQSSPLGLVRGGWGWDCRFVDFDNDGDLEAIRATGFVKGTINRWPELHALGTTNDQLISNPQYWPRFVPPTTDISGHNTNPFYVRHTNGRFVDIADELKLDETWNTRGLAVGDVDGDGWQDLIAANQWEDSVHFRNKSGRRPASTHNSFVGLHLILSPSNHSSSSEVSVREGHPDVGTPGRPAIGAIAEIRLPSGKTLISQVDGGTGHSGKNAPTIHFGLGASAPEMVDVTLRWRDRQGRIHRNAVQVKTGMWHTVELASGVTLP